MHRAASLSAHRALAGACLLAIALATTGCPGPSSPGPSGGSATPAKLTDPVLLDPKAGDLYAAELSHFSGAEFSDQEGPDEQTYGLMKVIDVSPEQITAITEDAGWPKPRGAINDLRGDLSDITWDDEEKIRILRSELPQLVADERIIETKRPAAR